MQAHNAEATGLIVSAPDNILLLAVQKAVATIPDEFHLAENFNWVALHEGQLPAFRRLDAAEDYQDIRRIYRALQSHNPNARNLLSAVSDGYIHNLIQNLVQEQPLEPNANIATSRPDDRFLTVDPRKLSQQFRQNVQLSLINSVSPDKWWMVSVDRAPGPLREWVTRYYGLANPAVAEPFIAAIANTNRILTVNLGQTLRVPPVPPVTDASPTPIAVVFDANDGKVHIRSLNERSELPFPIHENILHSASSWIFASPQHLAGPGFAFAPPFLSQAVREGAAYYGPSFQMGHLVLTRESCRGQALDSGTTPPTISASQVATNQKLYVLDFFDPQTTHEACPHGQKVLNVIYEAMLRAGHPELYANVVQVELDYFRHKSPQQKAYLFQYIQAQRNNATKELLQLTVSNFDQRDLRTVGTYETPLLYIQAVYDSIFKDPTASIATSAFYTESFGFSLFPDSFVDHRDTLVLSAVDDDPGAVEGFGLEPIRSLYDKRADYPVLLIGGLSNSTPFGMTSSGGDGVSCLGQGDGWGANQNASICIRPGDRGTSFATPSVAVTAFIARVILSQKHVALTANQIRDRLFKAVPVMVSVTKGYRSPGIPSLAWLIESPQLMVDLNGKATAVGSIQGSITFSKSNGGDFTEPFQAGDDGVGGIQIAGNTAFVFRNQKWEPVIIKSLKLTVTDLNGNQSPPFDLKTFRQSQIAVVAF
jgi:hypothetical protein